MSNLFWLTAKQMVRLWLTAKQMVRLLPFFSKRYDKPCVGDRQVLSSIIFVNCNGLRWAAPRRSMVPRRPLQPLEAVE